MYVCTCIYLQWMETNTCINFTYLYTILYFCTCIIYAVCDFYSKSLSAFLHRTTQTTSCIMYVHAYTYIDNKLLYNYRQLCTLLYYTPIMYNHTIYTQSSTKCFFIGTIIIIVLLIFCSTLFCNSSSPLCMELEGQKPYVKKEIVQISQNMWYLP